MSQLYSPKIVVLCEDEDCCSDGTEIVRCSFCKQDWPCDDYKDKHTEAQIEKEMRYADRIVHHNDEEIVEMLAKERAIARGKK